jgi:hypothetical protein
LGLGEVVVEGVLEADEFAEEGVVAAVGVRVVAGEELVELDLGVEAVGGGLEEAGAFEAGAGDFDEVAFDGVAAGVVVLEAAVDEVGAGEVVDVKR